jgi:hypothetical protein
VTAVLPCQASGDIFFHPPRIGRREFLPARNGHPSPQAGRFFNHYFRSRRISPSHEPNRHLKTVWLRVGDKLSAANLLQ